MPSHGLDLVTFRFFQTSRACNPWNERSFQLSRSVWGACICTWGEISAKARTIPDMAEHIALYAGSFDPPTLGHLDVISRARRLFDRIVVGIGENPEKQHMLSPDDRLALMQQVVGDMLDASPSGAPVEVRTYDGLTVDFARSIGAAALLRGIRNVTDLASECQLAIANRQVADIESVFVITDERYGFTSSSLIRQIVELGGDIQKLANIVPAAVLHHLDQANQ